MQIDIPAKLDSRRTQCHPRYLEVEQNKVYIDGQGVGIPRLEDNCLPGFSGKASIDSKRFPRAFEAVNYALIAL